MSIIISTLSVLSVVTLGAAVCLIYSLDKAKSTISKLTNDLHWAERDAVTWKREYTYSEDRPLELRDDTVELGLERVLFHARLPDGSTHKTDFVLGTGPCGKTVVWLEWLDGKDSGTYCITQYHDDGSHKKFIFKKTDVAGRIVLQRETMTKPEIVRKQTDRSGRVKWLN